MTHDPVCHVGDTMHNPVSCSILADDDFIWITNNTEFQDIL